MERKTKNAILSTNQKSLWDLAHFKEIDQIRSMELGSRYLWAHWDSS